MYTHAHTHTNRLPCAFGTCAPRHNNSSLAYSTEVIFCQYHNYWSPILELHTLIWNNLPEADVWFQTFQPIWLTFAIFLSKILAKSNFGNFTKMFLMIAASAIHVCTVMLPTWQLLYEWVFLYFRFYQNMGQPLSKPDSFVPWNVHQSGSGGGVL